MSDIEHAACAHLSVSWRTQQLPDGLTRGWWECASCGVHFMPCLPTEPDDIVRLDHMIGSGEKCSAVAVALECQHCGGAAITSATGMFAEDDGGACAECGFPGQVNVTEDGEAYWSAHDLDALAKCMRQDCGECRS